MLAERRYEFIECIAKGELYRRPCSETLYAKGNAVTLLSQCAIEMTSGRLENVVNQLDLKRKTGNQLFNEIEFGLRVVHLQSISASISTRNPSTHAEHARDSRSTSGLPDH